MGKLESSFQAKLIKDLEHLFPGCYILKNDPSYLQGVPDLILLWGDKWAMLEVKRKRDEKKQPNQEYYIDQLDQMSFAAFIYPENRDQILNELQQAFRAQGAPRLLVR